MTYQVQVDVAAREQIRALPGDALKEVGLLGRFGVTCEWTARGAD
ncbi:MAG TPA: hypothetical protein VHN80_23545 [Kineosporiaceae bacterium]|nr:hypothetical protein [Kineosporiaceae bacterium]